VQKVREAAARMSCANNLKQIGLGLHNYASANQDKLPPMLDYSPSGTPAYWQPFWFSLFPYIEQNALYTRAQGTDAWGNNNYNQVVKILLCPADGSHANGINSNGGNGGGWAVTSYSPVAGNPGTGAGLFGGANSYNTSKGVYIYGPKYNIGNIPDGTSNTVGVVERFAQYPSYGGWANCTIYPTSPSYWGFTNAESQYGYFGWYLPQVAVTPVNAHPYYPNTRHATMQTLLMDGSVRGVSASVSQVTWQNACIPDDGTPLGSNW
jgi:hypothetical protein